MNTTGELRKLNLDNPNVRDIDQKHFPRPWKDSDWVSLNSQHHGLWGWEKAGRLIGFALFHIPPQDDTAHLLKIIILPELRGAGEAQELWRCLSQKLLEEGIKRVYLEVEESNERARKFYSRMGFVVLRRVKSYYSDGEAAVMMQLTL